MSDGPEQVVRDEIFAEWLGKSAELEAAKRPFPSRWNCPVVQPWLYGYDALREVEVAVKEAQKEEKAEGKI